MDSSIDLLRIFSEVGGPSGYESRVREIVVSKFTPIARSVETDQMGSVIANLGGLEGSPKVMISAHMDEVGLMVKNVTEEGYIKFQQLGGWLDQAIVNQRWVILNDKKDVFGVTGIKTVHVMSPEERKKIFDAKELFIDVGAPTKEYVENKLGISPGDPIVPFSPFSVLNDGELLLGKAWDDRAGLALMIKVVQEIESSKSDKVNLLFAVATVQEEVGLRGATTSSYMVHPDIGINLEAGVAGDFPGITTDESQERIGMGPTIFLHDSSMIPNIKLRDFVKDVAQKKGIPLQFNVLTGYGQDGSVLQRSREGTPTINIAIPTRYLHSHNSVISYKDFEQAVSLVRSLVEGLDSKTVEYIKKF